MTASPNIRSSSQWSGHKSRVLLFISHRSGVCGPGRYASCHRAVTGFASYANCISSRYNYGGHIG